MNHRETVTSPLSDLRLSSIFAVLASVLILLCLVSGCARARQDECESLAGFAELAFLRGELPRSKDDFLRILDAWEDWEPFLKDKNEFRQFLHSMDEISVKYPEWRPSSPGHRLSPVGVGIVALRRGEKFELTAEMQGRPREEIFTPMYCSIEDPKLVDFQCRDLFIEAALELALSGRREIDLTDVLKKRQTNPFDRDAKAQVDGDIVIIHWRGATYRVPLAKPMDILNVQLAKSGPVHEGIQAFPNR